MSSESGYLGEVRLFAHTQPVSGWLPCDGQILNKSSYPALYGLLIGVYGVGSPTTFVLPDMRGRIAIGGGRSSLGAAGGSQTHTLSLFEIPSHTHLVQVFSGNATGSSPSGAVLAATSPPLYSNSPTTTTFMATDAIGVSGEALAHNNLQPYSVGQYRICTEGILPSPGYQSIDSTVGEVRFIAHDSVPGGWLPCDGRRILIYQYNILFAVIGYAFGGDQTSFSLPDLRGVAPIGAGQGPGLTARQFGQTGGQNTVTLEVTNLPPPQPRNAGGGRTSSAG